MSICVVIAAKDASATVGRSVATALRQAETREVFVVDDGSTDSTAAVAMEADDHSGRLRVIRRDVNSGPSAARNQAIAESSADLVSVLDADDYLADGRFFRMFAQAGDDWDLLADDLFLELQAEPKGPVRRLVGVQDGEIRTLNIAEFVAGNIADPRNPRNELGYLKPLMRRGFLIQSGLAYDETVRLGEDYILYANALLRGARFKLMPACGYMAVEHAGSLSHQHGAGDLAALAAATEGLIREAFNLAPEAVRLLESHRHGVQLKLDHRLALDARRRGDWPEVVRRLLRTPATTAYILGQTFQDKMNLNSSDRRASAGRSA